VTYQVIMSPTASRQLQERLLQAVARACYEFIRGPLAEEPRRVGAPLRRPFEGHWRARRGEYRVRYTIDDDDDRAGRTGDSRTVRDCRAMTTQRRAGRCATTPCRRRGASPSAFVLTTLMHDVPPEVVKQVMAADEPPQAETIFRQPVPPMDESGGLECTDIGKMNQASRCNVNRPMRQAALPRGSSSRYRGRGPMGRSVTVRPPDSPTELLRSARSRNRWSTRGRSVPWRAPQAERRW
jgi:mRNA interferase RelE/StbE